MLQLQMRKKTQEFQAAWQEVQEDLAREQRERAAVQSQLSAAVEQVDRAPAGQGWVCRTCKLVQSGVAAGLVAQAASTSAQTAGG